MAFRETGGSGLMMSADGAPVMSGTWYNPRTGHKFTVADSFFQDGNFMVKTTNGQMLDYNTIKDYVQSNSDAPTQQIQKQPISAQTIPAEVADEILPEDKEMISLGNLQKTNIDRTTGTYNTNYTPNNVEQDPDKTMIEKVLGKKTSPTIKPEIIWSDVPTKQIDTLIDILGVEPQKIVKYYISLLNKETILEACRAKLEEYITSQLPKEEIVQKDTQETKTKGGPKKTKKK